MQVVTNMLKIGLVINMEKNIQSEYLISILNWLKKNNCEILVPKEINFRLNTNFNSYELKDLYLLSDFILVFGGDGTILGNAREAAFFGTPLLGVNMGHLGFMTDVEEKDTFEALEELIKGNYCIEERMMLKAEVVNGASVKKTFYCLNEIGLSRGTLSKMLTLKISINNEYFDSYHADGLLISTPTGSTAYSLSAGGPIINPNIKAILITPLCPHSLSARSLVVSDMEIIETKIINPYHDAYLTVDGQIGYSIDPEDSIIVKKSEFMTRLIKISERSFYDVLRTKLKERFI